MESFFYLLFIILAPSFACCQKAVSTEEGQGIVYYVTATGTDCPLVHQQYCHSLHDYANRSHWPIESSNVTFLFLLGEHSFKGKFNIKGVSHVTLRGIESQFQSRPIIKCEAVDVTNVTTLYIENLNFNYYPNSIYLYKVDTIHIFKVSAQFLTVLIGSFLTILQSEFIVPHNITWTTTVDISDIMRAVVLKDTLISGGDCLAVFIYSECFHATINDTIMSCSIENGILIFNAFHKEPDCPESNDLILSNVTSISRNSSTSIYVDHIGKVRLIDIQMLSVNDIMLISTFGEISLTRVSVINAENDLSIITEMGQITLTDVSIINSGGLYIDYCSSCTLTNVHVSNSSYGIIVENTKMAISLINCTIANNSNTGLRVKGQAMLVFLAFPSHIVNNTSPGNGGGIWISQSISISFSTQVYITHNVAKGVGGAIYANDDGFENRYSYCTLRYWIHGNSTFQNNYGKLGGNNIYGGTYWDCCYKPFGIKVTDCFQLAKSGKNFNNQTKCNSNKVFHTFPSSFFQPSLIASNPIGVCICLNDGTTNCNIREIDIEIYPSESIHLSLATVGVCGGFSPGELVTSRGHYIDVSLQDTNQETSGKHCKNFTYKIDPHLLNKTGSFYLYHKGNPGANHLKGSSLSISVSFLSCPLGLVLSENNCQCSTVIRSINGTQCSIHWMPHPIRRSGNNWLSYDEEYNCTVAHNNCPFDYCNTSTVYLNLTHPDLQCTNGRSGILCGACQEGLSLMLGSNKCESCTDDYLLLVTGFILAGVALVIFLLVFNLTVSVGSINGLLFYANLVKLNEAALFPNGASIPVLSQFIAWLNLDLGIQTCFFNGLDGYWKTWLQFVFPLYIWLLIGIIIIACYYSGKVSRLCGNNAVPVLATLILMSYNKLLRAITNSSMFVMIKCEATEMHWSVWSVDGNINYLSGKHTPLLLIALLFLLIGLLYTGLVFSIQWLQRYSGKCCHKSSHDPVVRLKPFLDAYTGPYKNKYRYWTGLLLIIRLLLTTVFSYTTGTMPIINNYIISFVTFVLLILSKGVYRKRYLNVLEIFHLLNLGSLCLFNGLSDHMRFGHYTTVILTGVSVGMSLLAFTATLIIHIFKKRCSNYCKRKRAEREDFLLHENSATDDIKEEEYSPADIVISRREPLIFDF